MAMISHQRERRFGSRHTINVSSLPVACAVNLLTAIGFAQSPFASAPIYHQIRKEPEISERELARPSTISWPKNGGNLFNQNYSPLTQVNRQNVANLRGVWRTRLDGSGVNAKYSGEAQSIVEDGVIYIVTGADDVFAINIKTGRILWKYQANLADTISTVCCGWTSRGLGLGEGRVYVGQLDSRLVALDQRSGRVVWSIQAEGWQDGYTITAAPLYYDGMVIVGFAGGENGTRGRVKAYDAKSGSLIWTFYTVPGPGEFGHDTWPKDSDAWKHGGAAVWQTPAIDPELGLIYFSTGNQAPTSTARFGRETICFPSPSSR
jgi:quinohemoprotein ethanol dehydrogenase